MSQKVNIKTEDLELLFKTAKVKEGTKLVYLQSFRRIINNVFESKRPTNEILLNSQEKIMNFLKDITLTSQKTVLNGYLNCLEILKLDTKEFRKVFNTMAKTVDESRVLSKANETEEENHMTMKELEDLRDSIKLKITDQFTKFDTQYLLLCLYTMLPPLRGEEYYSSQLFNDSNKVKWNNVNENNINYLCLTKKQLILSKYKTEATYGKRIIDIPDDLIKILKEYKLKSKSKYVVCTVGNKQFSKQNFKNFLNATTEKKISSSMIRKIYLSEKNDSNFTAEERKKTALIMGHDVSTAFTKYTKFSEKLHNPEIVQVDLQVDNERLRKENEELKAIIAQLKGIINKAPDVVTVNIKEPEVIQLLGAKSKREEYFIANPEARVYDMDETKIRKPSSKVKVDKAFIEAHQQWDLDAHYDQISWEEEQIDELEKEMRITKDENRNNEIKIEIKTLKKSQRVNEKAVELYESGKLKYKEITWEDWAQEKEAKKVNK